MNDPGYPRFIKDVEAFKKRVDELRKITSKQKFSQQTFENELEKLEKDLVAFRENTLNDFGQKDALFKELSAQYEELVSEYKKLYEKYLALKSPPQGSSTYIRFIRMEKINAEGEQEFPLIEVKDSRGEVVRVYYIDEKTDYKNLKYGQRLVHSGQQANHVVEALNEFETEGVIASVVDTLAKDDNGPRYLISERQEGTAFVAHALGGVSTEALIKGSRVLVDTAACLILEVLPVEEKSEQYVVGEVPDVVFADIGGMQDVKDQVMRWLVHPVMFPETARRIGRPRPKGVVIQGGPGLGKTMLAKAIVNCLHEIYCTKKGLNRADVKPLFYSVNGPELLDKFVGVTEKRIRELFAEARKKSKEDNVPVGIFIDEAESLLGIRGSGISSDTEKTIVPQFTSEMQGLEESGADNVVVILASNLAHSIDAAIKRPGRCDLVITVKRPDKEGAREIFQKYLKPTWDEIHPKYNEDVYIPSDSGGKPRSGPDGIIKHQFKNDSARARDYLVDRAVERIFEKTARSLVGTVVYATALKGETAPTQSIYYSDLISGAIIANIVAWSKIIAMGRFTDSLQSKDMLNKSDEYCRRHSSELIKEGIEPLGVQLSDVYKAIEQVYAAVEIPNDSHSIRHWLLIENLAQGRDVKQISFERRAGDNEGD